MKIRNLINLTKLAALSLGLFITSCTSESFDEVPESNEGELVERIFMGETITVEKLEDGIYADGDMRIFEEQFSKSVNETEDNLTAPGGSIAKLGLANGITKWPNNTVIYVLDGSLSSNQIRVTRNSMEEWSSKTSIRFKERTNESYYVTIRNNGDQCNCASANLGVNGTRGRINMGVRTSEVVMIHEIGHTLGYIHEQTRSDRDDHVIILFQNIQDGAASQFRKNTRSTNIGEFDINSTMMYGAFTFSKNGQPTITRLDGTTHPRRRPELSAGDIAGTNQVYPGSGGGDGGGDGGGGDTDTCEGVDEWVRGQRYTVGDRVTYQGFLYERDFTRWNRILECSATQPADICDGVAAYNRNTNYVPGNKVTYRGFLYELQSNFRWANQGQCGN